MCTMELHRFGAYSLKLEPLRALLKLSDILTMQVGSFFHRRYGRLIAPTAVLGPEGLEEAWDDPSRTSQRQILDIGGKA